MYGLYTPNNTVYGCAFGHGLVIERALKRRPFKPFLILEDDALHEPIVNPSIILPSNADAYHLSTSNVGIDILSKRVVRDNIYFSRTEIPNVKRVYGMLSARAVLILTEEFARSWQRCSIEACALLVPIDVLTGLTHHLYHVYAQQHPFFYQSYGLGGREDETRFDLEGTQIPDIDVLDVLGLLNSGTSHVSSIMAEVLRI